MNTRIKLTSTMSRVCMLMLVTVFSMKATAQDVQIHYDFGRHLYSSEQSDRQKLTITYEAFKADRLG